MNGVGAGLEGKWAWPEWGAWLLVRSVGVVREGVGPGGEGSAPVQGYRREKGGVARV